MIAGTAQADSGNWSTNAAGNWSTAANWSSNPTVPGTVAGDIVGLNNNINAARTVTIDTTSHTVGTLNIGDSDNSHAFTLNASGGGTLIFDNSLSGASLNEVGSVADIINAPIVLNDDLAASIGGALTLGGTITTASGKTLTKSGAGTLTISGNNTHSANISSASGLTLSAAGTTTFNSNLTLSGGTLGISGAGTTLAGSGLLTLSGGVTFSIPNSGAGTIIGMDQRWNGNFFTTLVSASGQTITSSGSVTLGANVTVANKATIIINGAIGETGGSRNLTLTNNGGANTFIANGTNTYSGSTTISSGTFRIGGSGTLGSGSYAGNIINAAAFEYSSSSTQTLSGIISGAGTLTKNASSSSILTLSGANTYTGATTVNAGTLQAGVASVAGVSGAFGNGSAVTLANTAGVVLDLAGFNTRIVSLTGGAAAIVTNTGASATLTLVGTGNPSTTVAGAIAGPVALTKGGTGTLTLTGANNYSGLTTVSDGSVIVTKPSTMGGLTIAANKSFVYAPTTAGALDLGSGALTLNSGTTTSIGTALGGTLSQSAITSSGAASLSGTGVINIRLITGVAPVAGTHNLITAASGLTGGTYTLGTVFNNADFLLSNFARSATAISVDVGAAAALSGNVYWKGGLAGYAGVWSASTGVSGGQSNWQVTDGVNQPLVPGATADLVFSTATSPGTMAGMTLGADMTVRTLTINNTATAFGLTPDGKTLTITPSSSATGITVGSGVQASSIAVPLVLGAAQTWLNSSANTLTVSGGVNNGGNLLTIDGSGTTTLGTSTLSGGGGLTKNGAGYLNMQTTTQNYTGSLVINGGELMVPNGLPLPSGNITLNGGVLVGYWGDTWTRTLGSGVGQIQVLGGVSGFCGQGTTGVTITFNASAAYEVVWGAANEAGNVNATGYFNPSTLVLQSPIANQGGNINFQNKIDLNGTTRTIAVNKDPGATGGNATISGVIRASTGTAGIIKTGPGKLILSAANIHNGDTTVSAGGLALSGSGGIASSPNIVLASGTTFDVSARTAALTLAVGQTLKIGATGGNTSATNAVAASKGLTLNTAGIAFTAYAGGANPPLVVAGTGGSLDMNNAPVSITATHLDAGSYTLIGKNGAGATVTGSPGTLTVNGVASPSGFSLAVTGGELVLTVTAGGAGLDHFALSPISSPQDNVNPFTVTITAQDSINTTVPSFTGAGNNVTYSGTAGITGTSADFTAGVLANVSLTATSVGAGRTLVVTGGASKTGTTTFDVMAGVDGSIYLLR